MCLTTKISNGYSGGRVQDAPHSRSIFRVPGWRLEHMSSAGHAVFTERAWFGGFFDRLSFPQQEHGKKGEVHRGFATPDGMHPSLPIAPVSFHPNQRTKTNPGNAAERPGAGESAPNVGAFLREYAKRASKSPTARCFNHQHKRAVCALPHPPTPPRAGSEFQMRMTIIFSGTPAQIRGFLASGFERRNLLAGRPLVDADAETAAVMERAVKDGGAEIVFGNPARERVLDKTAERILESWQSDVNPEPIM
jgi:hypothetical protein